MRYIKTVTATKQHTKAIKLAIDVFGSQTNLSDFLGILPANVNAWLKGTQVIPLHQVERLVESKIENIPTFLEFRPDMKKYAKYYK